MALFKYCLIQDDGRRCQSCCNRSDVFGNRDKDSGWVGDCTECNVRWYRAVCNKQLRCASRTMKFAISQGKLLDLPRSVTTLVYECAGLCPVFRRKGVIFRHRLALLTSTVTTVLDDAPEAEWVKQMKSMPLTWFSRKKLAAGLQEQLMRGLPHRQLTLLDAILVNLVQRPCASERNEQALALRDGGIVTLYRPDYQRMKLKCHGCTGPCIKPVCNRFRFKL